jgi:hypothetical protein
MRMARPGKHDAVGDLVYLTSLSRLSSPPCAQVMPLTVRTRFHDIRCHAG